MTGVWARVQDLGLLSRRSRRESMLDDEQGMNTLRRPLMDVTGVSSDEEGDSELGLLSHSPSSARGSNDNLSDVSWSTRRKRRRRKDDDDLGEVRGAPGLTSFKPKFIRAVGHWVLSLSSVAGFYGGSQRTAFAKKASSSPLAEKMVGFGPKRKELSLEDQSERALAWMAGLTVALAFTLIISVSLQA